MSRAIHIAWLYPNILNIHGGRGDLMALKRIGEMMGLEIEIRRCESYSDDVPFEWADIVYMTSGEIKCMPEIVEALNRQRDMLDSFLAEGGSLWAVGSSGSVLGSRFDKLDGTSTEGLGLLDAVWKERVSVWGDDLWFSTGDGIQVMGNQIQVADIILGEDQEPFGETIYGRGNCSDGKEGAKKNNVVFTNCLGPMMVKNPKVAESLLKKVAEAAGIEGFRELKEDDVAIENKSFHLIKKFVENKMNNKK